MKRSTLLFILIFNCWYVAIAQTYIYKPFPTENGKWIYEYYPGFSNVYELKDDIIISSTAYKKMYLNSVYTGAIREENKIIYFYPDTASKEYVLYNFNLNVGDVVVNPFNGVFEACTNSELTVSFIDIISASDGDHKRFQLSNGARWIEGMGSVNFLLKPSIWICCTGPAILEWPYCNDELKCMISDLTFHYPAGEEPCIITSVEEEKSTRETLSIFPNPSNSSFTIDFKNMLIKEIKVSDVLGSVILTKNIRQEISYTIPSLQTGTYIVSIVDANNLVLHEKIVSTR